MWANSHRPPNEPSGVPEVERGERVQADDGVRDAPDAVVVQVEALQGHQVAHFRGHVRQTVLGQI